MSREEFVTAVLGGAYAGVGIVAVWVLGDALLLVLGSRYNLAEIVTFAWYPRPRRALSRERRTRPQGPGN